MFSKEAGPKKKIKKIISFFLVLLFSFSLLSFLIKPAYAQLSTAEAFSVPSTIQLVWSKIKEFITKGLTKAGSVALQTAVRNTLNKFAYESATNLASGGPGQKPVYEKWTFSKAMENVRDEAMGSFISQTSEFFASSTTGGYTDPKTGKKVSGGAKFNLCAPDLGAQLKIGLGLKQYAEPAKPTCNWKEFSKNWAEAVTNPNFSKNLNDYFDPTSNDLGASFTLQTGIMEDATVKQSYKDTMQKAGDGWLSVTNIAGINKSYPGHDEMQQEIAANATMNNVGKVTGDIFTDAANVFMNQFAVTFLNKMLAKLTEKSTGGTAGANLSNPEGLAKQGGTAGAQESLRKITDARFETRADYSILGDLSICNEESKIFGVSATNCVIDEKFRQAIESNLTVGEALSKGLLKSDATFGFKTVGNEALEPSSQEGYPYRATMILRKYRIVPVGWELAAQYIKDNADIRQFATLGNLTACFANGNVADESKRSGYYADWCKGLVDPDWVLKAPQNYCAKQGYGPQIIYSQAVVQGQDAAGNNLPPKLMVSRMDDYCADEQTCIKEKGDGSCEYYGYCTAEKRKWKFGAESCDPTFNTCQAYAKEDGSTISYLKNTLEFCDASNFGCKKYAIASADSYDQNTSKIDWSKSSGNIYLNQQAGVCEQTNEGCQEVLRIKTGLGSNLIPNSGFEGDGPGDASVLRRDMKTFINDYWPITGRAKIVDDAPDNGSNVLLVEYAASSGGLFSLDRSNAANDSIFPEGFVMELETSYTLSADVYLESGDRVELAIGRQGMKWQAVSMSDQGRWQRLSVTLRNNPDTLANEFHIYGYSSSNNIKFYVDNIKFEIGDAATPYSEYRSSNLAYEKLLPDYLEKTCYVDPEHKNYLLKDGAPAECSKYARKCQRDDANCEMYTAASDQRKIPAAIIYKDRCVEQCVGYDTFIQSENAFSSNRTEYFIPKTAKACSAASVGCQEFTSLASSTAGGEQKEYYSYLRQCVKPSDAGADCQEFYSFEGSQEQGQQIVRYSLNANGEQPAVTSDDSSLCSQTIYDLPPTDPRYNPDCRRFISKTGVETYHLYSRTVSCTNDCRSYRLAKKDQLDYINTNAGCADVSGHWDAANSACYICKNGGLWSDAQQSCVYKGYIPESISCAAVDNGCSEYNGNSGSNMKIVLSSSFESGDESWAGGAISRTSAVVGKSSYAFFDRISRAADTTVFRGNSYVLTFLAKALGGDVAVNADIGNGSTGQDSFDRGNGLTIKSDGWRLYTMNLANLAHTIQSDEKIFISVNPPNSGTVLIDDIKLTEIRDRYYLIRDSWQTPAVCDQDENGQPYPLFMLGCAEYQDRLGNTDYIHNFNRICQESAVGCEPMINTYNSTSHKSEASFGTRTLGVPVPADTAFYVVYDTAKQCGKVDKGCQRLAQVSNFEDAQIYKEAYVRNDPDKYSQTLCDASGVGCDKFTSDAGRDVYFKDPGDMVCEWRQPSGAGASVGWQWFKKKAKRCGGTGSACSGDTDCDYCNTNGTCVIAGVVGGACRDSADCGPNAGKCLLETKETLCPMDKMKTFGPGGLGREVYQPGRDERYAWAGLCAEEQSGCTEYIDQVSDFSTNEVANADFKQDVNNDLWADNWVFVSGNAGRQRINLEGNNLYVLAVEGANTAQIAVLPTAAAGFAPFFELQGDNTLVADGATSISVGSDEAKTFYLESNFSGDLEVSDRQSNNGTRNATKIILRKAVTDYQKVAEVDKNSCNGQANPSNGCVYLNERATAGSSGYAPLTDNSWLKTYGKNVNQGGPSFNANALIKVQPDRVCDSWLACKSYAKDKNNKNMCFAVGSCNRLDASGNCDNFIPSDGLLANQTYEPGKSNPETIKNLSGYSKFGLLNSYNPNFKPIPDDLAELGKMKQVGKEASVPNGDFEQFDLVSGNPGSWNPSSSKISSASLGSYFSVIGDPSRAAKEKVRYPVSGGALLKYSASTPDGFPVSGLITVNQNENYYLSFRINTLSLTAGQAEIIVFGDDNYEEKILVKASKDWATMVLEFRPSVNPVRIKLGATSGATGNVYIDDIRIGTVLLAQGEWNGMTNKYDNSFFIPQTCRLYPKEDSLSCEYTDENGAVNRGERGYCLEYDRAPGNPDACLLWYPVDKSLGQGSEEGAGYSGKSPLYYCTEAQGKAKYYYEFDGDDWHRLFILDSNGNDEFLSDPEAPYANRPVRGYVYLSPGKHVIIVHAMQGWVGSWTQEERDKNWNNTPVYVAAMLEDVAAGTTVIKTSVSQYDWKCAVLDIYYNGDNGCPPSGCLLEVDDQYSKYGGFLDPNFTYDQRWFDPVKQAELPDGAKTIKGSPDAIWAPNPASANGQSRNTREFGIEVICRATFVVNPTCKTFVSVTGPLGENKVYKTRMSGASSEFTYSYNKTPDLTGPVTESGAFNNSNNPYFGISYPEPANSPSQWDADSSTDGLQPLAYQADIKKSNMGYVHGVDNLKKLFAQSYGWWTWSSGYCDSGQDKGAACLDKKICEGGGCYACGANTLPGREGSACQPAQNGCLCKSVEGAGARGAATYYCDGDPTKPLCCPSVQNICTSNKVCSITPATSCTKDADCLPQNNSVCSPVVGENPGLCVVDGKAAGQCNTNFCSGGKCTGESRYELDNKLSDWTPPQNLCFGTGHGDSHCGIPPNIENIKINDISTNVFLNKGGFVTLTFNSKVDKEQLPIVSYEVDWRDGEISAVSGVEINQRSDSNKPHSVFHSYDYWDLLSKVNPTDGVIKCEPVSNSVPRAYCKVKPRVKIMDNWGWCSEGRNNVPCPSVGSGVCMNASRGASSVECKSNSDCAADPTTRSAFPFCSDGFYEFGGEVIVYEY